MIPLPHRYVANAVAEQTSSVVIHRDGLPSIASAPPREFDGPGNVWSPEELLCAAIGDCFVLTFRSIARAAGLPWARLECSVDGTLERSGGGAQFTQFVTRAELHVVHAVDCERARSLLEKAERACLVANSLKAERTLVAHVLAQVNLQNCA